MSDAGETLAGVDWTREYRPLADAPDEAFAGTNRPRPLYAALLAALAAHDPRQLATAVRERVRRERVTFGGEGEPFCLDPVPRLIEGEEWGRIEAGLTQRAEALDAFAADAYDERRIFSDGEAPMRILDRSPLHEPRMREVEGRRWVDICGFDLARRANGEMVVLEDNVRTPSGIAYASFAREVIAELVDCPGPEPRVIDSAASLLAEAMRAAAPADRDREPRMAVVSEGVQSAAFYEHRALARGLGAALVTIDELETSGKRLWARTESGREPVDVLYRRTADSRLTAEDGRLTALGEAIYEPLAAGNLGVVNAFGAGIADDKLSYAYSEKMIRFYLDEEPLIRVIPTYDLAVPEQRREALGRLDELVIKPRFGAGGEQVLIVGEADPADARSARARILDRPEEWIAQERISLSTHPCLAGDALEPRRVDLRPFAYATADGYRVLGGLTRYAPDPESMVVNSAQGGGAKDTWVLG